jgi:predicted RNase H-like nuclease
VSGVEAMQQDSALLWQQALQDAIEEPDPQVARVKIANAEMAIFNRMQGFTPNGDFSEEHALFDALETIRALDSKRRRELPHSKHTRKGF